MRWQRRFREAYQKDPDFRPIWEDVSGLIRQNLPSLSAVTLATLAYLLETITAVCGGSIPLLIAGSSIETPSERTQRLVKICADQQLTHLIMGRDAVACHDCDLLRASGLVLVHHVYQGPTARAPRPGVTVLHDVFRFGRAGVAQRLTNDWSLEPITGRLD